MNQQDPLAALEPLRAPPPVGLWPPAPGWWLLAALLLLAAGAAVLLVYRRWRRGAALRQARRELAVLRAHAARDPARVAQEANAILKRVARARFPQRQTAALARERWITFLNDCARDVHFRPEWADLPYAAAPEPTAVVAFCGEAERWLRARPRGRRAS